MKTIKIVYPNGDQANCVEQKSGEYDCVINGVDGWTMSKYSVQGAIDTAHRNGAEVTITE